MATNILMPALSPTMTEGTLARWLKKEGDTVTAGDVIAEIETDKATMEVEAVDEGVLGKIVVADGTAGVPVNATIAILVEQGEAVPAAGAPAAKAEPASVAPQTADSSPKPSAAGPSMAASQVPAAAPALAPVANGHDRGERVFATPLARRIAKGGRNRAAGDPWQRPERAHCQGGCRGGQGRRDTRPGSRGSRRAGAPGCTPVCAGRSPGRRAAPGRDRREAYAVAKHQYAAKSLRAA